MKRAISVILCLALLLCIMPFDLAWAGYSTIALDVERTVNCSSAGDWTVFTFTPEDDGIYIFSSSGTLDTMGYIALEPNEAENEYIKADGGQDDNFAVTYNMSAGTTYYLGATVLTGTTGKFKVKLIKFEVDDDTIYPITLGSSTQVSCLTEDKVKFLSFVPTTTGKYVYNSSGSYDTRGYVFDGYWRQIAYSYDGGSGNNFKITLDLQAGTTYYFGYTSTYSGTARFNVLLYMISALSSITVETMPYKTTYLKDIDALSIGNYLYHVDLNLRGFELCINYANGSHEIKKYTQGIRGLNLDTSQTVGMGDNYIRFDYMGKNVSLKISVEETPVQSLSLVRAPFKSVYYDEDAETAINGEKIFNISLRGMVIKVNYKDGSTSQFTINSFGGEETYGEDIDYFYFNHVVPASAMRLGTNAFTLKYYGVPLSFTVQYSLNEDNWSYEVKDGEATLTQYTGTDTRAVVPERVGGYPVTAIGESCFEKNKTLTEVRLTSNITSIGAKAFYDCSSLEELTVPASVTSLGKEALYKLTSLKKLTWNANILTLSNLNNTFGYMGRDVAGGTTVEFGFDCTLIPSNMFYCSGNTFAPHIGKIIVGENVNTVGTSAFREVKDLQVVEWNATQITEDVGAGNNIWYLAAGDGSFEVHVGEYVASLPSYLFHATNDTRAPRVSEFIFEGKDTLVSSNTFRKHADVDLTFYCHYNEDSSLNTIYKYCVDTKQNYVLLDSPLERIYMRSQPQKTDYIAGESLDLSGLEMYAVYEDGSEMEVTDKIVVSGFDNTLIATQHLTLTYSFIDKSASVNFDVRVSEEPLILDYVSIITPAAQTAFFEGDIFTAEGLEVAAHFTNGVVENVSALIVVSGFDMSVPGTQSVNVSYTYEEVTRETDYTITVMEVVLTELVVVSEPTKTDYLVGETFDPDGLSVSAFYNNGEEREVAPLCDLSGFDLSQKGTQSVSVVYSDGTVTASAAFSIHVTNNLIRLTLPSLPSKTEFVVGDSFTTQGLRAKARYANGTTADVSDSVVVTGYDMSRAGEQTVSVTFTDDGISQTATYTILVSEFTLSSLKLVNAPTAPQFTREPLHTEGLSVQARFNNGSTQDVTEQVVLTGFDNTITGSQTVTASYTFVGKTLSVDFEVFVYLKSPTGIEITQLPDKTAYLLEETADYEGLQVSLLFDNNTKQLLAAEDLVFSGFTTATAGKKTITVSYTEETRSWKTTFSINVSNYETAVHVTPPSKTSYFYGEHFSAAGMSLTLNMADGASQTIYSGFGYTAFDPLQPGEQTITVSYTSDISGRVLTDNFTVEVVNYETAVSFTPPTQSVYFYGDAIRSAGMSAVAEMADGSQMVLESARIMLSGYNAQKLGKQIVTASLLSAKGVTFSDTFPVTVQNYETDITVTPPAKTEYFYGDTLSYAGLGLTATYADGSTGVVSAEDAEVIGFEPQTVGTQELTVVYTNLQGDPVTDTFEVTVSNYETAITVTPPDKVAYFYNDSFDATGMCAVARMADGSETLIDAGRLNVSGYRAQTLGTQTLSVSCTGAKGNVLGDMFAITVQNYEAGLEITETGKTAYSYGETLDTSALRVKAVMADGTKIALEEDAFTVTGFDEYVVGDQMLTVSLVNAKGNTVTAHYSVNVKNIGTSIKVTAPTKTAYFYGDALNTAGMSASIENVDGSSTPINASALTVTGYNPALLGEQDITVTYITEESLILRDRFTVTVSNFEQSLSVTKAGQTAFLFGDDFAAGDLQVSAVMADGSTQVLRTEALSLSGYDAQTAGTQTVTVGFTNAKGQLIKTTYEVEVINYETSFVLTAPTKKQYYYGEALDTTGIKAIGVMADRSMMNVETQRLYCSGYNPNLLGEQTVTVNLDTAKGTTLTRTYKVTVNNYEAFITVTPPTVTEYFYGEALNTAGMKTTATMADGSKKTLSSAACTMEGFESTNIGVQHVNVSFTNVRGDVLTDSFETAVKNYEVGLSVTPPTKTVYELGEALNTAGMTATAAMADGSTRPVAVEELSFEGYDAQQEGTASVNAVLIGAQGDTLCDTFTVEVVLPHVHAYTAVVTQPTCTEQGFTTHTCSCGDSYIDSYVSAKGHTQAPAVKENETAATCTHAGSYEDVVYCTVCGVEVSRVPKTVEQLAHTPAAAVIENETAATCAAEGSYDEVVYCSVCGAEMERGTKAVEKLAHTPAAAVKENEKASTCTAEGSYDEVVYCAVCGAEMERDTKSVAKLAHTPATKVIEREKAATCTRAGSYDEVIYCLVCGEEIERTTITVAKLAHTPAPAIREHETAATCTAEGSFEEVVKCDVCGTVLSRQTKTIEKAEHTPAAAVRENETASTCTAEGSYEEVVRCEVCGTVLSRQTKTIAKLAHTSAAAVKENEKPATCTAEGSYEEVVKCEICGTVLSRQTKTTAKLAHTPAASVKENEKTATCTGAGSYDEVIRCSVCKTVLEKKTVSVAAKGHNFVNRSKVNPTTVKAGYIEQECTACGAKKVSITAPTGKVKTLKCKTRSAASQTITWSALAGAEGYQIQITNKGTTQWGNIYGAKKATSYTIKKLTAGSKYQFRVRIYATGVDGNTVYGEWSSAFTSPTLPKGTSLTKLTGGGKSVTAQWKKNSTVTGYRLQYSLKSNFARAKSVSIKSNKTLKTTIKKLSAKKTYYVRVCTYKTIDKVKYYSAWSKALKVKTK